MVFSTDPAPVSASSPTTSFVQGNQSQTRSSTTFTPPIITRSSTTFTPPITNGEIDRALQDLQARFFWKSPFKDEQRAARKGQLLDKLFHKIATLPDDKIALCIHRLTSANISCGLLGGPSLVRLKDQLEAQQFAASFQSRRTAISPPQPPKQPSMMENLSLAFSYFSADHEPSNPWEAMAMLQVYAGAILVPVALTLALDGVFIEDFTIPGYHRAYLFGATAAVLLASRGVVAAYAHFNRIPVQIKPLINYTSTVLTGNVEPLLGRDQEIEKVFLSWESTTETIRQHPLLVGPAGVGKTAIMTEVARRIALNEIPDSMQSTLKGKVVFGGPAATLLPTNQMFETEEKFERFLRRVLPIRKEIILALDEIHAFMNEQFGFRYGELLKSLLDTSARGLPYMLFATTDEEYRKYIADDPARARRFLPIYVRSLSKADVLSVLQHLIRVQYPGLPITGSLLEYIYIESLKLCTEFTHLKQPEAAKRILTRAISQIAVDQSRPPSANLLAKKQGELLSLQRQNFSLVRSKTEKFNRLTAISTLQSEAKNLENSFRSEVKGLADFKTVVRRLDDCEESIIATAQKANAALSTKDTEANLKHFLFNNYYLLPYLKQRREQLIKTHSIPMLDEAAVDKVIKELRESLKQARVKEKSGASKGGAVPPPKPAPIVTRKTPCKYDGKVYQQAIATRGGGACSLHALNGNKKVEGAWAYVTDPKGDINQVNQNAKEEFLGRLEKRKAAPDCQNLFQDCIQEFISGSRELNKKYQDAQKKDLDLVKQAKDQLRQIYLEAIEAPIFDKIWDNLRTTKPEYEKMNKDELQETLRTPDNCWNAFQAIRDQIVRHLELIPNFKDAYNHLENAQNSLNSASMEFCEGLWDTYSKSVLVDSYQLTNNELHLAALLYDKRVILFSDAQDPEVFNPGGKESVAINHEGSHKGGHYSRLEES